MDFFLTKEDLSIMGTDKQQIIYDNYPMQTIKSLNKAPYINMQNGNIIIDKLSNELDTSLVESIENNIYVGAIYQYQ